MTESERIYKKALTDILLAIESDHRNQEIPSWFLHKVRDACQGIEAIIYRTPAVVGLDIRLKQEPQNDNTTGISDTK